MPHRRDLISKGYQGIYISNKRDIQAKLRWLKFQYEIRKYRIVPLGRKWELYVKW